MVLLLAVSCASRREPDALALVSAGPADPPRLDLAVETVATELPPQDSVYRVGPNDVLHVQVPKHPEFGGGLLGLEGRPLGLRVTENGTIDVPLLGEVVVAGRPVREIRAEIQQRLGEYLEKPHVSVEVLEYASQKCYLLGAFEKPGAIPLDGDTTLLEAVAVAGGIKEGGDLEGAYVVRGRTLLPVSLADLLLRGDTSRNLFLRHGDLVYVPPAVRWQVYVLGEVRQPGIVPIPQAYGLTLTAAVAKAGGLDLLHADRDEIRVFRGSWQAPRSFTLSVDDLYRYGEHIRLHPGDRIHVAPRGLASWSRTMQLLIPFIQPTLSAATTAAVLTD
jgi:polysaccharide export outer membrane protein